MNITELENRPRIYAMEDGVVELVMGLAWIVAGGTWLPFDVLPKGSSSAQHYTWVAQAIWLCSSFGMGWGIRRLKERVTYPRGGYVALEDRRVENLGGLSERALIAIFMLAVSLWMVVCFWWLGSEHKLTLSVRLFVPAFSVFFTVGYLVSAIRYHLRRYIWLAAFSTLTGAWLYYIDGGLPELLLCQGVPLAVAGGTQMRRFVKSHPKPSETEA